MRSNQGYRPRIPAPVTLTLEDAAKRAGLPIMVWLIDAIREKAQRESEEVKKPRKRGEVA